MRIKNKLIFIIFALIIAITNIITISFATEDDIISEEITCEQNVSGYEQGWSGEWSVPYSGTYNNFHYDVISVYDYDKHANTDKFVRIDAYSGNEARLIIPSTIDNYPVKIVESLMSGVDDYDYSPTSVVIPESVKYIGRSAFNGMDKIESIEIPNSVLEIGSHAFAYCTNLKSITIPDSVTYMGRSVFYYCKNLKTVKLSNSLTTIGNNVFESCDNLEEITIPKSVNNLGNSMFQYCSSLKKVKIENGGITELPYNTFFVCTSLESIELADTIKIIKYNAFFSCENLKKIILPYYLLEIESSAFYNCANLKDIIIPEGVTTIGDRAFEGCDGLKSVKIPRTVTSIGNGVFIEGGTSRNLNITIYGYIDSYAEEYAKLNSFKFVALDGEHSDTALPFKDIEPFKWYTSSVQYVYRNNLMTGYTSGLNAGNFGLNDPITRGQIATMLYRLAGEPNTTGLSNPFTDVPSGKYYTEPVKWAFSKGITTGKTATKFDPDGPVTRQELAVFMARYSKEILGNDITSTYNISGIADYNDLSTWARAPMQYIMEKGVITGDMKLGYARILPKNNATRAEAATMFTRFCQNVLEME